MTTISRITIDIIHYIYDYTTYGEHCMINKDTYNYKKTQVLEDFYSVQQSECSNGDEITESCGHFCTPCDSIVLQYKVVIGYTMEIYADRSRVYEFCKLNSCKTCFYLAFTKFYKLEKRIPYLRRDGHTMRYYIKNSYKTPENELLSFISNKNYHKLKHLQFDFISSKNTYISDYYNRIRYCEILEDYVHPDVYL